MIPNLGSIRKTGRNDPCWCGSGVKYKKCHYRRSDDVLDLDQVYRSIRTCFANGRCLAPVDPPCEKTPVKAHSVSRNVLRLLARDGHVYELSHDQSKILSTHCRGENLPDDQILRTRLVGIDSRASTFAGFCSQHDNSLFCQIDTSDFELTPSSVALFTYRVAAMELIRKECMQRSIPLLRNLDAGRTIKQQEIIQDYLRGKLEGTEHAIKELQFHLKQLGVMLQRNDFADLKYVGFITDKVAPLACAGFKAPEFDFDGNPLQNIGDLSRALDWIACTVVPYRNESIALFSWVNGATVSQAFADSLRSKQTVFWAVLLTFLVESFENLYFKPDWWEGIDDDWQTKIRKLFRDSIDKDQGVYASDPYFVDDSVHLDKIVYSKNVGAA